MHMYMYQKCEFNSERKPVGVVEVVALIFVPVIVVVLWGEADHLKKILSILKKDNNDNFCIKNILIMMLINYTTLTCPLDTAGDKTLSPQPGSQKLAHVPS